jgi:putative tributyrin esterase
MAFMEIHFTSKVLDLSVSVNVLVPDDIKEGEKLKVLYLLHGYMGNHTDWVRYTSIERYLWNHRMIVIMPSAMNSYYADMAYGMPFSHISLKNFLSIWKSYYRFLNEEKTDMFAGYRWVAMEHSK